MVKYYIDTSIWIDLLDDRIGFRNEPLGKYALHLFAMIREERTTLIVTDILIMELHQRYSLEEINGMLAPFQNNLKKIHTTKEQHREAETIAKERGLPRGDALHAIIARDHDLLLVARDKHFNQLKDIWTVSKPEELI